MDVRSPGGGQLSPDGKRLYFGWTVTGTAQVWRLDGPNTFPIQMTGGEDRTSLADITPDGKTLILSRDRKGEENPGLYLMPADGGPMKVVQHLPKVQTAFEFVSDDGKWLYFRANDVKPNAVRDLPLRARRRARRRRSSTSRASGSSPTTATTAACSSSKATGSHDGRVLGVGPGEEGEDAAPRRRQARATTAPSTARRKASSSSSRPSSASSGAATSSRPASGRRSRPS